MRFLLSGGQACILYGATEFSRDADIVVLLSDENLHALRRALRELDAEQVFVPALEPAALHRGHACHFRCRHSEAAGVRLDVMSVLRGCDPFPALWERRSKVELPGVGEVPILSLRDLVQSKKTQRDKDWGHVRRLVEGDYLARKAGAADEDVAWWLAELRTPGYLRELAAAYPGAAARVATRPWLAAAAREGNDALERELGEEERRIRDEDRAYWQPLRQELERMRRTASRRDASRE
ncbi:MAG: hypothetical protein FJ291_20020 [Planctomycetes bacterium]|nr:hypothetical protein [Planctomycetota bacterium]